MALPAGTGREFLPEMGRRPEERVIWPPPHATPIGLQFSAFPDHPEIFCGGAPFKNNDVEFLTPPRTRPGQSGAGNSSNRWRQGTACRS